MSSVLKNLIVATSLVLAGTAPSKAEQPGYIEGHLKIISPRVVEPSDEMPRPEVAPESYGEYPLVILSQEGKKEIARVTADANGNYRAALPPGDYILDVQGRARKHVRWKPKPFTVVSNQTVRVDMDIDTDHWRAGSTQSFRSN
jgi:hypothetical protein